MKISHYKEYFSDQYTLEIRQVKEEEIIEGYLINTKNDQNVPITGAIPRFVESQNYADNFAIQWNIFQTTQLDSKSGLNITAQRFWENTKWSKESLSGKTVLEVGSGAGRFTEILLEAGAKVVSFDYSNAVEANSRNNSEKGDLLLFQGDLYNLPFPDHFFDYVFCYGVLQHTPNPDEAYRRIFSKLNPGGKISIDYYRKYWYPHIYSTPKYLWRPITSRMHPELLYSVIKAYMPWYLPLNTWIRRIPKLGYRLLALIPIPCWNYTELDLTPQKRLEWAIMDTFDALGAKYDFPKTLNEIEKMIESPDNATSEVFYGSNGIVANVSKKV
jgi:SAM-dependent methyltransferase